MNLSELKNKIESYPGDTMPFSLSFPFSWRGIYAEVCFSISTGEATKQDNLNIIEMAVMNEFEGYKGGLYRYDCSTNVNFEDSIREYSDGDYLLQFLANNHNEAITHIFGD